MLKWIKYTIIILTFIAFLPFFILFGVPMGIAWLVAWAFDDEEGCFMGSIFVLLVLPWMVLVVNIVDWVLKTWL
jgi:hypothetical protein